MTKLLYLPFGIISGLVARLIGRQIFRAVWSQIDEEPPPKPGDGTDALHKVVGGRALQGAVMAGSAAAVERMFAAVFHYLTGSWPNRPDSSKDR